MGSEQFNSEVKASDAKEAFAKAVQEAQYDCGHSGYTGTIAEKHSYVYLGKLSESEARNAIEAALERGDFDDKWGPAGCIEVATEDEQSRFIFFGWASC